MNANGLLRRLPGDVDQELERAGVAVADAARETHCGVDDSFAQFVREPRRGRNLDDLLEMPLHAALALAEMGDGALGVAEDLHLDVACPADELLHVEVAVAERGQRFRPAALVGRRHLAGVGHPARAAAPAAAHRLDHHAAALAQGVEEGRRLVDGHGMVDAANHRYAGLRRRRPGPRLVAEQFQRLDARTHEGHPRLGAAPGEVGVLCQKAVARMQRVAAGVHGGRDDLLDVEIRRRAGAVQGDGLVRLARVQRSGVVGGRHRHRRHAEFRRRAHDADRDLAAVRHQELHWLFIPSLLVATTCRRWVASFWFEARVSGCSRALGRSRRGYPRDR